MKFHESIISFSAYLAIFSLSNIVFSIHFNHIIFIINQIFNDSNHLDHKNGVINHKSQFDPSLHSFGYLVNIVNVSLCLKIT